MKLSHRRKLEDDQEPTCSPTQCAPPSLRQRQMGRSFCLRSGLFCLQLVFAPYRNLAWSFILTVYIRFGLSCLRLKFGSVFPAYDGKSARSFLLTVPLVWKLDLVFFSYSLPTTKEKDEPSVKDLKCKLKSASQMGNVFRLG